MREGLGCWTDLQESLLTFRDVRRSIHHKDAIAAEVAATHVMNGQAGIGGAGNGVAAAEPLISRRGGAGGHHTKDGVIAFPHGPTQRLACDSGKFNRGPIETPTEHNITAGSSQAIDRDEV